MRVILLGATGVFGQRLAHLLAAIPNLQVVLVSRSIATLAALRETLLTINSTTIEIEALDISQPDLGDALKNLLPDVVVDTCGPFQQRDYRLARLAIAQGFHLIDLADAPEYVAGIGLRDAEAKNANVLVTSGASSVPALSSAVVSHYAANFSQLDSIEMGISPGNQTKRGLATIHSILPTVGKPHAQYRDGQIITPSGWSGLKRYVFAEPVGARWLAYCAVPDPLVLPQQFPAVRDIHFRAGLELKRLHFGVWLSSLLVRAGLLHSLSPYAAWARRLSEFFLHTGSDNGAMYVALRGLDRQGNRAGIRWELIAEKDHGPFVPASPAASLVRLLATNQLSQRGALPCVGILSLSEIKQTLTPYAIRYIETYHG